MGEREVLSSKGQLLWLLFRLLILEKTSADWKDPEAPDLLLVSSLVVLSNITFAGAILL